jgi:hypothetical protein
MRTLSAPEADLFLTKLTRIPAMHDVIAIPALLSRRGDLMFTIFGP